MIPYLDLRAITIGPIHVHVFGLLLTVGVIVGHLCLVRRARAMGLGAPWVIEGFAMALGVGAILATIGVSRLVPHGLSSVVGFFGAIAAGAAYTLALGCDVLRFADAAAYAFPFGWLFARLGCAAVHDHLGRPSSSFLAVRFPSGSRLDLGLLEALSTLLLIAAVEALRRRGRERPGVTAGVVAIGYALIRFPLDFLRDEELDPRMAGLTLAQWGAIPLLAFGVAALALQGKPVSNVSR